MTTPLNADPAELAKFSELAHRWWDPESEFRPLHQINPLRLDWIQSLSPLTGQKVIDIGCGGGILADAMARAGATVTGIDLAGKALKVAQLHALEVETPNISYREISAEAMARINEAYQTLSDPVARHLYDDQPPVEQSAHQGAHAGQPRSYISQDPDEVIGLEIS